MQMWQLLQRGGGGNEASGDLESRLNASKGGGSALAPEVQAFMEPRFGADFSAVRVHTDGEAVQMNQELGAQAFTHGMDEKARVRMLPLMKWAQQLAKTVPPGYLERLQTLQNSDFLTALDDPNDQEAIKIGFELWRLAEKGVTVQNIHDAVRIPQTRVANLKTEPCR